MEAHARVSSSEPTADVTSIIDAVRAQAQAENPLAWPVVRPVLLALRGCWHASGFPEHGVALRAILEAVPDECFDLFQATIRTLERGGYLMASSDLAIAGVPGEVAFLDRAHAAIDGWPGASSEELVENLLAAIARAETATDDPGEQRRLRKLGETVREVGVATAGDVLARAMMGKWVSPRISRSRRCRLSVRGNPTARSWPPSSYQSHASYRPPRYQPATSYCRQEHPMTSAPAQVATKDSESPSPLPRPRRRKLLRPDASCRSNFPQADDGTRTRYLELGKLALYQVSYVRRPGGGLYAAGAAAGAL